MSGSQNERWQKIEEVFARALELAPAERERFVAEACQDHDGLSIEVMALLGSADRAAASLRSAVADGFKLLAGARTVSPDQVIGQRFTIERHVGTGGMGTVYRALDQVSASPVAVKLVTSLAADDQERFEREVRVLSGLQHAGIVRYVAHGTDPQVGPFLAMEWLEGEDLATRLARAPLTLGESLVLARQVAQALAYAHGRGVVHRDIKPSNLWLTDGSPHSVKLLDFGIARARDTATLTGTNAIIGTVGYMAPEQARGQRSIAAAADLFSLGCVLYECVTGHPAFSGDHSVAILIKLLHDEPPPLRELRPELSLELEALIGRLLDKDADRRSSDAMAIAAAIDRLAGLDAPAPPPIRSTTTKPAASSGEQRILQLLLVDPSADTSSGRDRGDRTLGIDELASWLAAVNRATASFDATLTPLRNGMILLTLPERGSARDRAEAGGAAALAIVQLVPLARIAIASGRGTQGRVPPSVIDRCAAILAATSPGRVSIDETSARLLDERFIIEPGDARIPALLVEERAQLGNERLLLGKPTPCVGRMKELALVEAMIDESFEESIARSLLVTATAGYGKSRLAHELLRRVTARRALQIVTVRGDPVEAGSNLALLRPLVRHLAGIDSDASTEVCERALHAILDGAAPDPRRAVEFLIGDVLGRSLPAPCTPEFEAARSNPIELYAWLERSVLELLEACSRKGPLLLVLDDLHWAGAATVRYIGEALRRLHARPLFVLALARSEVDALFSKPWPALQRLVLDPLTRRAATELVHAGLGRAVPEAELGAMVDRAQGNAFYLEEFVRALAAGRSDLPETVQAMVEARLQAEGAEARHLLRAASVLGERCSPPAVAALTERTESDARAILERLAQAELLDADREDRSGFVFRHAIVRDVAYAMLPPVDRVDMHRRAASWLESHDETDPIILANHHEQAGNDSAVAEYLSRAVVQTYGLGQVPRTFELARRALVIPALTLEQRSRVEVSRGAAFLQSGSWAEVNMSSSEVLRTAAPSSAERVRALGYQTVALCYMGRVSDALELTTALAKEVVDHAPTSGNAVYMAGSALWLTGQRELLQSLNTVLRRYAETATDPSVASLSQAGFAIAVTHTLGDVGGAVRLAERVEPLLRQVASSVTSGWSEWGRVIAFWNAGDDERARAVAERLYSDAAVRELPFLHHCIQATLGYLGVLPPDVASPALGEFSEHLLRFQLGGEAQARLAIGDRQEAERLATLVWEHPDPVVWADASAGTILARLALERGDTIRALALAECVAALERTRCVALRHTSEAWSCLVDVHVARGDRAAAERAQRDARERLLAIAEGMDPPARRVFLTAEPYRRLLARPS